MKKILFSLVVITMASSSAEAQLSKLFKKKDKGKTEKKALPPKEVELFPGEFTDDKGWSGTYYVKDTMWYASNGFISNGARIQPKGTKAKNSEGRYVYATKVKFKYEKMKDGNVVNSFKQLTHSEDNYGLDGEYFLAEKFNSKYEITYFYKRNYDEIYLFLEPGVILWFEGDMGDFEIDEILGIYVKDPAKLEVWNEEIAAAKFEQLAMEFNKKKVEVGRKKYSKMPTYMAMKGKVGFIDAYHKLTYNRIDEIKEKPETFMSSIELGKTSIFYKAFYETPGSALCMGCEWNVTYEMGDVKVGRVQQRRESATWSRMIKQKFVDDNFFSFVPSMINYQRNIADYAFLKVLYENKDKLKDGAKIPVKVTVSTCRDGVDQDIMATGTLTLVIKEANRAGIDKALEWYEKTFID